jgi:ATP-dependent Clp protease ATP-binding subunit ClpB
MRQKGAWDMQDQPAPAKSVLEKYTHDLTALARQGRFAPLLRREKEVERVFQILARRLKNNPMLIGEDATERFAIVAEVIRRISIGNVPDGITFQRVVALDLEALIADTRIRGDLEKLLRSDIEEIRRSAGQVLLFVDQFHVLAGAGRAENAIDMANILVPVLARGEARIIGTSTLDDYRKYVERDAALQRRFQEILVSS